MTPATDYHSICNEVQKIAREAGSFIRGEREKVSEKDVQLKSVASLVTYVDKTAEARIVEALGELIPGSGFITEEGTASYSGEKYKWIVDPLDGTTNFIHGIAPHSVSIALMEDEKAVVGVVFEIGQNEMFYAWKGGPAFLNDREIKVSTASNLADTLIGTGFPYYAFERVDNYIGAIKELMQQTRGLRRFGSAAVDLAYVAAGRFDAFFEHALHAWDVAAGAFILQQAGGRVSDFNGADNWLYGGEIVACSEAIYPDFYSIVNKYLGHS
ncbi:myo-inositol-1(or 4)-monophosphatase [Mariniphaga anaerophila]|uniref:Inositol-1-monophosphatase n=1 Tax=Mariniphaga anaerophila TaxID=1484053 RepID=A0A1M4Y8K7_9BACT|nr:inositol monophosphatase family protein [Mariniphaga anaerophila]SHF01933.1 myo-inositol-1(or 4)-monophosphatase [Mariniphaga anaerophila]